METPTLKVLAATLLISWYNSQCRSEYAFTVSPSFMDIVIRESNGFETRPQVTNLVITVNRSLFQSIEQSLLVIVGKYGLQKSPFNCLKEWRIGNLLQGGTTRGDSLHCYLTLRVHPMSLRSRSSSEKSLLLFLCKGGLYLAPVPTHRGQCPFSMSL